jgi:uncharacterized cupredoxin-like copper-binding protein
MNKSFLKLLLSILLFMGARCELMAQVPREIIIETPGLLFKEPRFLVKPGEQIKLTLKNTDEMSHDFVLTRPNQRERVIALALAMLTANPNETGFIPNTPSIIQSIPMLKPGEEKSITFTAPDKEGIYPYLCTYPGHGTVMYGAMYVSVMPMPPIDVDSNVPESLRHPGGRSMAGHDMMHMGGTGAAAAKTVTIYRTYMPDSGPASIAVGLPGGISYNWDAGVCRLRYAWSGGFVNLDKNWMGNGKDLAEVQGTIFYRENTAAPIRIGEKEHVPVHQFKGYTMVNGFPTFNYLLDGVKVSERIVAAPKGNGIQRTLTFTNLKKPLWFVRDNANKKPLIIAGGKWEGTYLSIKPVGGNARLVLMYIK